MGQRRLDAVNALDQGIFQSAAALHEDRSQGHAGQLLYTPLADLSQDGKGGPMAGRRGQGVEEDSAQPQYPHDQAPVQIKGEILLSFHQSLHDSHDYKIGRDRKSHTDHCQDHPDRHAYGCSCYLPQHPCHRRRGLS